MALICHFWARCDVQRRSECLDRFVELFGRGMPLVTRTLKEDEEGFRMSFYAIFGFLLG